MRSYIRYIVLILLFISCNKKYNNDHLAIFKYNESSGLSSLDPAFAKDQASIWVANQIFNGLVQLDHDLNIVPSIAKSWSISEDALEYQFTLRNDVYFHDHKIFNEGKGRRVEASDFEYSFERLRDKNIVSPGGWILNNVEDFYAHKDSVFVIQLKKPFPGFLSLLTMQYCSVVPKEINLYKDFNIHPVGTGPFKFQLWKQGVKLVLRRNENYFEKDTQNNRLPYLDAIAINFIKDKQTAFLEFIQGNLDFISGVDASYIDEVLTKEGELRLKYHEKITLTSQPYLNTEYLGFLMNKSIPIEIRKAINYGFDRAKMLKYLRNNIGKAANYGIVPPGIPSFTTNIKGYNYNIDEAKRLIAESDFDLNNEIILSTNSSYLDLCEYIQYQLGELGLKIKLNVNPPSTHRDMVANSKLQFFRASWIADYPDAENYLSLFYSKNFSPNGPNYTHFISKEFDELYNNSLSENNIIERNRMYQEMDQIIIDNAVIVPLYYDEVLRFTQKNISGLNSNAMNMLDLKTVRKE